MFVYQFINNGLCDSNVKISCTICTMLIYSFLHNTACNLTVTEMLFKSTLSRKMCLHVTRGELSEYLIKQAALFETPSTKDIEY